MPPTLLPDLRAVLGALDHPVARWDIGAGLCPPAYALEGAVAVVGRFGAHPQTGIGLLGADAGVRALLTDPVVQHRIHDRGVSYIGTPRHLLGELERSVDVDRGGDWDWMATTSEPPVQSGEERLVPLDAVDEILAFHTEHSPRTHARPFHDPTETWVGIRDDDGGLLAAGSIERSCGGIPYLSGIAVAASAREGGLGAAVTAYLTRIAVRDKGVATLGVFADNAVAIRLYHRLGYTTHIEWATRWLTSSP